MIVAERRLARPGDRLAHVEMDVLRALREHAVERPNRDIGSEQLDRGAIPPLRVDQCIRQAADRAQHGAAEIGDGHRLHPSNTDAVSQFQVTPVIVPSRNAHRARVANGNG